VTLYILCQLKSTWVKFTHCRLVNYKLVGRFRIYYFMNIFLLILTMKFIFYKCRFHFTVVVNLKNLQISVLASPFFLYFAPPLTSCPSISFVALLIFFLPDLFRLLVTFFHLFIGVAEIFYLQLIWLMFYFDSEWFKFFPLLTSCQSNSLSLVAS